MVASHPIVLLPFQSFGKIPRLTALQMTVTEKIDGTNACVVVDSFGDVGAQSRKRFIVPGDDNYGFAAWVKENEDDLRGLGEGYHFGEWWGRGIQRGYGLEERRFSLFNVGRWHDDYSDLGGPEKAPACCHVVPVLRQGAFSPDEILDAGYELKANGSVAAPFWPDPEGVMVYVSHLNAYLKHPFDPRPKESVS